MTGRRGISRTGYDKKKITLAGPHPTTATLPTVTLTAATITAALTTFPHPSPPPSLSPSGPKVVGSRTYVDRRAQGVASLSLLAGYALFFKPAPPDAEW